MFISHFKSLSGKARHQGLLTHDREGRFTTEMGKWLPQRSPLRWRCRSPLCSLPSAFFSGWCRMQKRLTRRRQQQADDTPSSLIKLRGFGLSAGHFTFSHYAELFSETENDALSAIENSLSLGIASATLCATRGRFSCFLCENTKRIARSSRPQVFSRKCAPASSLSSASCSLGVTSAPFSHCTAPWRSSSSPTSSSSCPTLQSTSSPPDT